MTVPPFEEVTIDSVSDGGSRPSVPASSPKVGIAQNGVRELLLHVMGGNLRSEGLFGRDLMDYHTIDKVKP